VECETQSLERAIAALRAADLIDETSAMPIAMGDGTRREILRKVVVASASAMLVPTITTLTAAPVYAQTTGTVSSCGPCTDSSQCQGSVTCGPTGSCGSDLLAVGAACSASSDCCSNNCKKVEEAFRTCQP
jgi:hypothetical protein